MLPTDEHGASERMFPRYHQWRAVKQLVDTITDEGHGRRYLLEHAGGSGKTNTIAWTALRLARLHDQAHEKVLDKVLMISVRRVLDAQLQQAVEQVDDTVGTVAVIYNALDPFMASPEPRETLTDAAPLREGAFGKLTGERERADEFFRLIDAYLYHSRHLRTVDSEGPDDANAPVWTW